MNADEFGRFTTCYDTLARNLWSALRFVAAVSFWLRVYGDHSTASQSGASDTDTASLPMPLQSRPDFFLRMAS